MDVNTEQSNSLTASIFSALMDVACSFACVAAWHYTSHIGYLIAGAGFLIIIPVTYKAPLTAAILKAPVFSNIRNRRKLSTPLAALSLIGYTTILIGLGYALLF